MSIDVILGPLSDPDWRRLERFVEAARTGQRAQGKSDDPLREVAGVIVARRGEQLPGNAWSIPVGDDDELLGGLRAALIAARTPHSIVAPDPDSGLAEHISWHVHGQDEHEYACLRTVSGFIAMTPEVWARIALVSRDEDIRLRLNDYFFFAGHGEHVGDIPVDVDPDVPEAERWALDEPVLLPDEWAVIGRLWGDIDLRDRLNALFDEGERAHLGEGEDFDDEDLDDGLAEDEIEGEAVED